MKGARRLDVASPQDKDDLAVLEVALPPGLTLPHAPMALAAQLPRGTWVWNIGIAQKWDMPDRAGGLGPQDVVTGLRRVGSLRTPPGASGGAGVIDSGVIGMVLQDGGIGSDYSVLLPVERIVQLFAAWNLPTNLLVVSSGVVRAPPETTWRKQASGTSSILFSVYFAADGQRGWAVGANSTILATQNGGETWRMQATPLKGTAFRPVRVVADGTRGWVLANEDTLTVLTTKNGGETWHVQRTPYKFYCFGECLHFSADGRLGWVVGDDGAIFASQDGGETWRKQASGTSRNLTSVYFAADGQRGWAVGSTGTILATQNGGETWRKQASGTSSMLFSVYFAADGQRGWAAGYDNTILATKNGGETWLPQSSGIINNDILLSIRFTADGSRGWIVGRTSAGDKGLILATQNGGETWQTQVSGTFYGLYGIYLVADGTRGWAVGLEGTILRFGLSD